MKLGLDLANLNMMRRFSTPYRLRSTLDKGNMLSFHQQTLTLKHGKYSNILVSGGNHPSVETR